MNMQWRALIIGSCLAAWHPAAPAIDGLTLELGRGEKSADRVGVALRWDTPQRWFDTGDWYLGAYLETSLSHWQGRRGKTGNDSITEIGLTPVVRLQPRARRGGMQPYVEAGIGAHLLSETRFGDKRLSTGYQFGDHVGAGITFGDRGEFDLGYRFQHLSNCAIKEPNPGINFHLIRLSYSLN